MFLLVTHLGDLSAPSRFQIHEGNTVIRVRFTVLSLLHSSLSFEICTRTFSMSLFDDGPPPLSSATFHDISSHSDGGVADLDDGSRLTAVLDEDVEDQGITRSSNYAPETIPVPGEPSSSGIEFSCSVSKESDDTCPKVARIGQSRQTPESANENNASCERNAGASAEVENGEREVLDSSEQCVHTDELVNEESFSSKEIEEAGTSLRPDFSVQEDRVADKNVSFEKHIPNDSDDLSAFDVKNEEVTSSKSKIFHKESVEHRSTFNGNGGSDDDDEFGDFAASDLLAEEEASELKKKQLEPGSVTKENEEEAGDNTGTGWSADFSQMNFQRPSSTKTVECSGAPLKYAAENDGLWILENEDHNTDEDDHEMCRSITELFDTYSLSEEVLDQFSISAKLWRSASIVEEAVALKMIWSDSLLYNKFTKSLGLSVDLAARKNDHLPAFAQQLDENSVLRPVSVTGSIELNRQGVASSGSTSNGSGGLRSSLGDQAKASSDGSNRERDSVVVESLAVEPVQFDWGNSGLTNPLTAGSISSSSAILDLSFLTSRGEPAMTTCSLTNSVSSDNISNTLWKDLDALGLNSSNSTFSSEADSLSLKTDKPSLLEQLMKEEKNIKQYTPVSELSLDARALHDQLPDIDYMLANVLLFPMADR
ncbi:hypothetical protein AB6A40_008035 [Gnathostoma spinigerum]|uniref:Aftiphilin n=1 Tax=Gnathostoma spinigerum TaxID=75299 RepID=A0ABD6EV36_9BILA